MTESRAHKSWSDQEIAYLEAHYLTQTHAEIAEYLGRGQGAVRNHCYKLRLHKAIQPWSPDEDRLLAELYAKYPQTCFLDAVAVELGRPRAGVACRANELGLTIRTRPKAMQHVRASSTNPASFEHTRNGRGASTHGGFREDLGIYVRSTWEANYARYLRWLQRQGQIAGWQYEPKTFEFPVRRGTRFYTPDFLVTRLDGRIEYHEVKGYMTQQARTALKRMERYYPEAKLIVIDGPVYKALRRDVRRLVPDWETN